MLKNKFIVGFLLIGLISIFFIINYYYNNTDGIIQIDNNIKNEQINTLDNLPPVDDPFAGST